jgi:hypothetical protein
MIWLFGDFSCDLADVSVGLSLGNSSARPPPIATTKRASEIFTPRRKISLLARINKIARA